MANLSAAIVFIAEWTPRAFCCSSLHPDARQYFSINPARRVYGGPYMV